MTDFFLFGSLRHAPLLTLVLGQPAGARAQPAVLADHQALLAGPRGPATLCGRPGQEADGLLLRGLSAGEAERLAFWAGVTGCRAVDLTVDGVGVKGFVAEAVSPEQPFDFNAWQGTWAPLACLVAPEIMGQFGRWPAEEFGEHRLKAIETRASARLRAPQRARPTRFDLEKDLVLKDRRLPYLNFFAMTEVDLQHRMFDGSMSEIMTRAAVTVGDASIVLPYDPVRDSVLLVQQFRAATYIAGDSAPWIWEAPAGLVDPGESPEDAAHREAGEEAKLTLSRLERVAGAYSSTGASSEFCHIFVGIADLEGAGALGGLASEGEDIHGEVMSFEAFNADLQAGRFVNLQLVAAGFWLALNRERLRAQG